MRINPFLLALPLLVVACSAQSPHCADVSPVVPLQMQQAAFTNVTMHGATRDFQVFRRGAGPPIILFHELPGLSPATFRLAYRLSEEHFTVYVPLLFGSPGDYQPARNYVRIRFFNKEFDLHNRTSSGRIARELQPLVAQIDRAHGGTGVAAIGMCLTGTLPLELFALGAPIRAAAVSQPALPFGSAETLPIPPGTLERMASSHVPVVAARFTADTKSPAVRMNAIRQTFGNEAVHEIPSGRGTSIPAKAHAVLTSWYCDTPGDLRRKFLDRVVEISRPTSGKDQ